MYFARREIPIPKGVLDTPQEELEKMVQEVSQGDDDYVPAFLEEDDGTVDEASEAELEETLALLGWEEKT